MVLFGKVVEALGGGALLEEVCHWGQASFSSLLLVVRNVISQLASPVACVHRY